MSWFKNPWESANPWAEGKPEFKKAIGTVVDDVNTSDDNLTGGSSSLGYKATLTILDAKNKKLSMKIENSASYKVIWYSSKTSQNMFTSSLSDIQHALDSTFGFSGSLTYNMPFNPVTGKQYPEGKLVEWTIEYNFASTYSIDLAYSTDQINDSKLIVLVVDKIGKRHIKEVGFEGTIEIGGCFGTGQRIMTLKENSYADRNNMKHLVCHEEGHRLGLGHVHAASNLMSYKTYTSLTLNVNQQSEIVKYFLATALHKLGHKEGTVSNSPSFGKAIDDIDAHIVKLEDENEGIQYTRPKIKSK